MAKFTYDCTTHGHFVVSLDKRAKTLLCPECKNKCYSVIKPASSRIVERLDNGVMTKAVERLHNIEEIMEKRDSDHQSQQGVFVSDNEPTDD
jgi:hypothetical protein